MSEERREATSEAVKNMEEAEVMCSNVVDQVSQAWEALMDDAESKKLANELTTTSKHTTHTTKTPHRKDGRDVGWSVKNYMHHSAYTLEGARNHCINREGNAGTCQF